MGAARSDEDPGCLRLPAVLPSRVVGEDRFRCRGDAPGDGRTRRGGPRLGVPVNGEEPAVLVPPPPTRGEGFHDSGLQSADGTPERDDHAKDHVSEGRGVVRCLVNRGEGDGNEEVRAVGEHRAVRSQPYRQDGSPLLPVVSFLADPSFLRRFQAGTLKLIVSLI